MPSCGVVARVVAGVLAAFMAMYIGPDGMDIAAYDPWREGGFMASPPPYWRDHRVKATPGIHIAYPPNDTAPPIPAAIEYFAVLGLEEVATPPEFAGSGSSSFPSASSMASVVLRTLGHLALRSIYIFAGLSVISNRFLTRHHALPPPPPPPLPPSPELQAAICTALPSSPPSSPSLSAIASSSMKAPPPPLRLDSPASKLSFSAVHVNVDMAPTTPPASVPTPASEIGTQPPTPQSRPASGPRFNPDANNFVPNAGQGPIVPPFGGPGSPTPSPNFGPGYGGPHYNPGYRGPYPFPNLGPYNPGFGGGGGHPPFRPDFGNRGAVPPAPGATQADWDAYLARFPNHGQQQPRFF